MDEIAAGDEVWQSKEIEAAPKKKLVKPRLNKAKALPMPGFIAPELATLTDEIPRGEGWISEVKFDGYRALTYLNNGKVTMYTRTGQDWTQKFRTVADVMEGFPAKTAILDGEIVALDEHGLSSFKQLQNALSENTGELHYYLFDILYLDGKDLRTLPLLERKQILKPLLTDLSNEVIFFSDHFQNNNKDLMQTICSMQLEGVISKRADAPYRSGRGRSWLKTKCHRRQEFIIGGFTLPTHGSRGVGALHVGYYEEEKLIYAGKVGTGFDNETSLKLRKKLDTIRQDDAPFVNVTPKGKRGAQWVKPQLVCEVEFTEWTGDLHLRHPSFQGLREDKPPKAIHRDQPEKAAKAVKKAKAETKKTPAKLHASRKKENGKILVGGIGISHPDRIVYPEAGYTKLALAEYYHTMASYIIPHVKQRPLSIVRCPEGISEECFFQRHIGRGEMPHIYDTGIEVKGRKETYFMIKDAKGLVTLAQWGVIELHPWGAQAKHADKADRMIFDLDPDPGLPWRHVIDAAKEVRQRMAEFGLESFVKTTGGKGIHVVIPMSPSYGWKTIKAFARAIAESMESDNSARYISTMSKAARKGKIFVDYLRNDLTSTAVASYSARARDAATVAMPITWEELSPSLKPAAYTIKSAPEYVEKRKHDPWEDFFKVRQKISAKYLRALKIEI